MELPMLYRSMINRLVLDIYLMSSEYSTCSEVYEAKA